MLIRNSYKYCIYNILKRFRNKSRTSYYKRVIFTLFYAKLYIFFSDNQIKEKENFMTAFGRNSNCILQMHQCILEKNMIIE